MWRHTRRRPRRLNNNGQLHEPGRAVSAPRGVGIDTCGRTPSSGPDRSPPIVDEADTETPIRGTIRQAENCVAAGGEGPVDPAHQVGRKLPEIGTGIGRGLCKVQHQATTAQVIEAILGPDESPVTLRLTTPGAAIGGGRLSPGGSAARTSGAASMAPATPASSRLVADAMRADICQVN